MRADHSKPFDRWIFDSYDVKSEGLGLYRIVASLFILFFLIPGAGFEHYRYLSSLPSDFYNPPPGPLALLDTFPPFTVFQILYALVILSVLSMLIGYRTKLASILSGIFILFLQGLIYSIGKVNHEILVPLVPIIMAFSHWGNSFSIDAVRPNARTPEAESWPLVLISLFIGFMMFTSGWPKILGGWLDPSTHAVKAHLLNQFFVHDREAFLAGYAIQINNDLFWELLDWGTIVFEIGFLIAVRKAKWFKLFLVMAVFFHFSTKMLLNISFLPNFVAYAVFLPWHRLYLSNLAIFQRVTGLNKKRSELGSVTFIIVSVTTLFATLKLISHQEWFYLDSDLMLHESVFLFFALFVVLWISTQYLLERNRKWH